jgi:rhodanese-related sulfurtransferase
MLGNLFSRLAGTAPDPEAQARVARGALVLDVRTPEEYASGHHPAAKNIPVQSLGARLAGLDRARSVVVYCRSGARSAAAKRLLDAAGFADVYDASTMDRLG